MDLFASSGDGEERATLTDGLFAPDAARLGRDIAVPNVGDGLRRVVRYLRTRSDRLGDILAANVEAGTRSDVGLQREEREWEGRRRMRNAE